MAENALSSSFGTVRFPVTGHASKSVAEEDEDDYFLTFALNLNCPNQILSDIYPSGATGCFS